MMINKFYCGIYFLCLVQISYAYNDMSCEDLRGDWNTFCKGSTSTYTWCADVKSSLDSCPHQLGVIPVTAIDDPYIPYIPGAGGGYPSVTSGGGGASSPAYQLSVSAAKATNQDSQKDQCSVKSPHPITIASGQKTQQEQDFSTPWEMPLEFTRYYDSFATGNADFVAKWQHSYDYKLMRNSQGEAIRKLPDGSHYFINSLGAVNYVNNQWVVNLPEGDVEVYNVNGQLLSKKNAHGIGWTLAYDNWNLIKVTHTNGKTIQLTWSGHQITKVIDPTGNVYTYSYNNNRLTGVTYPDSTGSKTYHYGENGATAHELSGISINGKRYNTYYYSNGKAIQSGRSDGTQNDKLTYANNSTTLTNPLGATLKYTYTDNNKDKLSKIERSGVSNCPNSSALTGYDGKGYVISKTDWNGIETKYDRDSYGRVTYEWIGFSEDATTMERNIHKVWATNANVLLKESYNAVFSGNFQHLGQSGTSKEVSYEYYADNHAAKKRIKSIKTCSKTGTTTCNTIGYGYSFHSNGMPSAIAISRNDKTTTYSYDSTGNLTQVKNALGHITKYSDYNGLGLVGKITDATGLVIEYVYDARGRITSKKETLATDQVRTTTYQYGAFGVTQTETNGMRETISYNDNGTILSITHGVGSQITSGQYFTYSNLGKLLTVEYKEGSNSRFSQSNTHNQLGWTTADKGNNSQNIRYEYDGNGNVIKQTDSLGKITSYAYEVFWGQLVSETRPDGLKIDYSYDSFGNMASVKDSKGNTTTYTYDGFGNVLTETSSERGTTTYQYDADGNLTKLTRANNVATSYSYDVLNRRTKAQTGTEIQTWLYDDCSNGKGQLCGTSDGITSTGYGYTKDGQLAVQTTKIDGVSYPVHWTYDSYGRLIGESRASNSFKVSYAYDSLSRVNSVKVRISGVDQTVASDIQYEPYGGIKNWTYGNGLTRATSYDKDYRLIGITTDTIQKLGHSYNANNWITKITNSLETNRTTTNSYDALGQLTKAASTQYTESWAFDNNGNRSSRIGNTSLTTSYQTTTGNRLAKTTTTEAKNFTYDSLGNLTKKTGHGGTVDYTYDGFNRLKTVKSGSVTTTYNYDVFNLRSRKSSSAGSVNYIYAPDGRLTAETNSAGGLHTVYIWLDGEIIGLVRGNKLYTTHNDHLGRPEVITDSTKKVVWKSQNTSYDSNVIQSSIGAFNIGFPGQYYDVESNLWYNWNRYYDATIGRYTQSDPIGLAGGLNTYTYVGNNPVGFVDWNGLTPAACVAGPWGCAVGGVLALATGIYSEINKPDLSHEFAKQTDYLRYKNQCNNPPPPSGDKCEDMRQNYDFLKQCRDLRQNWDDKYSPGRHNADIRNLNKGMKNIERKYNNAYDCRGQAFCQDK